MKDHSVLIDEKQNSTKRAAIILEPIGLFSKFQEGVHNIHKQQLRLLRDFLIASIELACAHHSGVCANFTLKKNSKKRQIKLLEICFSWKITKHFPLVVMQL